MLLVALQFECEATFWMLVVLCESYFPDFYSRRPCDPAALPPCYPATLPPCHPDFLLQATAA